MTEIRLTRNKDTYIVEAYNHADDDRLCSSISTLLYTLANFVEDKADIVLEPGEAKIIYTLDSSIPFDMVKGCFEMLKEEYPEKIILTVSEKFGEIKNKK